MVDARRFTERNQLVAVFRDPLFVSALPGKNAKAFLESIDFATPYGGHPVVMKWGDAMNPMWDDVKEGRKSARDAAREASTKLKDLLKQTSS